MLSLQIFSKELFFGREKEGWLYYNWITKPLAELEIKIEEES